MNHDSRILVAGRDTLAGAALVEQLTAAGYRQLLQPSAAELDLTCADRVEAYFAAARPQYVFLAAGRSGGIGLNRARPAELMRDNLLVVTSVVHASHLCGVKKLLYLGSSCSYPRLSPQPLRVDSLMDGPLEPTSAAYATAKLAGWQLCAAYRQQYGHAFVTAIPANPFGPHDDFSADGGHVIPALLRRTHQAKVHGEATLTIWGSGAALREFLYSADLADACVFVMQHYDGAGPINLGGGVEVSIADAARAIADVVSYRGRLCFDTTRPDGAPRKCLDAGTLLGLGWRPRTSFHDALERTYRWYLDHVEATGASTDTAPHREDTTDVHVAVPHAVPDSPGRGRGRARLPERSHQESRPPVHRAGSGVGRGV